MAHDRIVQDPEVMAGKPVIKGTRVPVYILVRECANGPPEYVAGLYDNITADDVRAALAYAAEQVQSAPPRHAAE